MRQHSSFPLLMASAEPKVRILWAVTLNWVRYSVFSSWLVFNIYVRISASSLSFSPHPSCNCLFGPSTQDVEVTLESLNSEKKKKIILYSVFSLTLPENLGVSPDWESSGYTFDTNHWKFLQPSLFCSWRRSLQSGFSAFMEKGQQGYRCICVRDARSGNDYTGIISTTFSILSVVDVDMYLLWHMQRGRFSYRLLQTLC